MYHVTRCIFARQKSIDRDYECIYIHMYMCIYMYICIRIRMEPVGQRYVLDVSRSREIEKQFVVKKKIKQKRNQ